MRCRVGDLAIIVRSLSGNEGRVVRCIVYLGRQPFEGPPDDLWGDDCWGVEAPGIQPDPVARLVVGCDAVFPDVYLRPIRDPGEDARDQALDWQPTVPMAREETA